VNGGQSSKSFLVGHCHSQEFKMVANKIGWTIEISKPVHLLPELLSGGMRSNTTVPLVGSSVLFTSTAAIRSLNPKETFQTQRHSVL